MAIADGVDADATHFNAAFVSKTTDDATTGVLGLNNTSNVNSGNAVANVQRAINKCLDVSGIASESDANAKVYANHNYIADGDSRKTAIEKLDAALHTEAVTARVTSLLGQTGSPATGAVSVNSGASSISTASTTGGLTLTFNGFDRQRVNDFVIVNNQSSPADIITITPDSYCGARFWFRLKRGNNLLTGSLDLNVRSDGTIQIQNDFNENNDCGVTFSAVYSTVDPDNSYLKLQYTSTSTGTTGYLSFEVMAYPL